MGFQRHDPGETEQAESKTENRKECGRQTNALLMPFETAFFFFGQAVLTEHMTEERPESNQQGTDSRCKNPIEHG